MNNPQSAIERTKAITLIVVAVIMAIAVGGGLVQVGQVLRLALIAALLSQVLQRPKQSLTMLCGLSMHPKQVPMLLTLFVKLAPMLKHSQII